MHDTLQQSGIIPYRCREGGVEVLLITASRSQQWQFPKGMLEPGLSPRESAEQEAAEEAGALGIAHDQPVTHYTYRKLGARQCRVALFAMPVQRVLPDEKWEEGWLRRRRWASLEEAEALIADPAIRQCLADFRAWCIVSL